MHAGHCEPTKPLDEHVHDSYVAKKIVPNATSIRHEAVWPAVTPPSDTAIEDILLSRNFKKRVLNGGVGGYHGSASFFTPR